jgi:hypothetical protein
MIGNTTPRSVIIKSPWIEYAGIEAAFSVHLRIGVLSVCRIQKYRKPCLIERIFTGIISSSL